MTPEQIVVIGVILAVAAVFAVAILTVIGVTWLIGSTRRVVTDLHETVTSASPYQGGG